MKSQWLNLVLKLTNLIYTKKQTVIEQNGFRVIISVFVLFVYEIMLSVISLPLYLGLKTASVTAFFRSKGAYDKITYDYNLRRVLTLTGVGIVGFIWLIKLSVILFAPRVYGPIALYNVSDLRPMDLLKQVVVPIDSKIATSKIDNSMIVAEVTNIEKKDADNYIFYGTGQPLMMAVLFLSDKETAVITDVIDKNGQWQITHSQKDLRLAQGNHSVVAFSYDEKKDLRSQSSAEKFFRVQTSYFDRLLKNFDVFVNSSIVVVIGFGILLTVLTL
jgi:hypothetical protein